jgi:hypothetical protein
MIDEWVFAAWSGDVGIISAHRLIEPSEPGVEPSGWYWSVLVEVGMPLVLLSEFEVPIRSQRQVIKAEGLWAEHVCDAPLEQWTVSNEAMAVALDEPADALGRAYGTPTPMAIDLEWYAIDGPVPLVGSSADAPAPDERVDGELADGELAGGRAAGFEQAGVVHGVVEVAGRPRRELIEVPARRWRRWREVPRSYQGVVFAPLPFPVARAHTQTRAPLRFPDGEVLDLVLTAEGWHRRPQMATATES